MGERVGDREYELSIQFCDKKWKQFVIFIPLSNIFISLVGVVVGFASFAVVGCKGL